LKESTLEGIINAMQRGNQAVSGGLGVGVGRGNARQPGPRPGPAEFAALLARPRSGLQPPVPCSSARAKACMCAALD